MRAGLRNSQFGSVSLSTLLFHVIFLERGLKGIDRAGSSESESAFGGELTSCESTPSVSKSTLLGKGGGREMCWGGLYQASCICLRAL